MPRPYVAIRNNTKTRLGLALPMRCYAIRSRNSSLHNQGYSKPGAAFAVHIKTAPLRYFTNPLLYFTKPLLHIANPLLDIAIQFLSRTTVSNTIPALHFGQLHLDQSKHDNAATERFYTNPLRNFTPLHQRNSSQIRYAASRGHNKESQHFTKTSESSTLPMPYTTKLLTTLQIVSLPGVTVPLPVSALLSLCGTRRYFALA